ncbi:MAG: M23 family metallopeptidase [Clostridia bacterium]|nr:M23 family metallopeptidase [Clostridia bacterium]
MRSGKRYTEKKGDPFLRLTFIQLAAAVLVFCLLFLLVKKDGSLAARITGEFEALMSRDWDIAAALKEEYEAVFSGGDEDGQAYVPVFGAQTQPEQENAVLLTAAADDNKAQGAFLTESFYASSEPVLPVCGPVTSDYGYRIHPIYGGESFHSGRDISADEGTGIRAVYDGVVADVGVGESSGNYVKIDHGNGLVALYCHCSLVYAKEGDVVRKGDIIAAVGHTGAATGPHLHFEIRVDGELCDPAELLDRAENVY